MYKWLPSKGLVIVFTIVAVFVGMVAFFTLLQPKADTNSSLAVSSEAISDALLASASKDADGDGLADWEENLRGTDPNKTDTDGDGASDGQEVADGRDPLKNGDDTTKPVQDDTSLDLTAQVAPGEGVSNTDALAINLFKNYLSKKEGGQEITATDQQQIVSAIAASGNVASKPQHFDIADVSVVANSPSALTTYNKELNAALAPVLSIKEHELLTFQNSISGEDPRALATFRTDLALYDQTIRALIAMKVPKDALTAHLAMTNALSSMKTMLSDLQKLSEDPLIAFIAMSTFDAREASVNQAFRDLGSFLLVHNLALTLPS